MGKFIVRRFLLMLLTMLIVSMVVFAVTEIVPGDVAWHILGRFAQPEQVELFRKQLGLNQPIYIRYLDWLVGTDWRASMKIGMPVVQRADPNTGVIEWWAEAHDGILKQWEMEDGEIIEHQLRTDGTEISIAAEDVWRRGDSGDIEFWGVDIANHAVLWKRGVVIEEAGAMSDGRAQLLAAGGVEYIPLQRGLLRGDPGYSTRLQRPVAETIFRRLRNSVTLAALSFVVVMPIALALGLVAGINEGKAIDRILSIFGLITTSSPNFATGIFLILILAIWLDLLPGATVFIDDKAIFQKPEMLVLPILTLTLIELGYILRITRASMVEVMRMDYMRQAILKGLPYWQVIVKHAVQNALLAPITVIMLHVNWLIGSIVVVEAVFGFPGLGTYLLRSALNKDIYAIEAGTMLMVVLAVGTQLAADLIYTLLNPRIRYA